jgi:hypothetical protein
LYVGYQTQKSSDTFLFRAHDHVFANDVPRTITRSRGSHSLNDQAVGWLTSRAVRMTPFDWRISQFVL